MNTTEELEPCGHCGTKPRHGRVMHDKSCRMRRAAALDRGAVVASHGAGPLRPDSHVINPPDLYDADQLARWLAYIGLDGRWCWVGQARWMRWDGKKWKRADIGHVREAVRLALTSLCEKSEGAPGRHDLLTIDRTFSLTELLRGVVKVDPERAGVRR